MPSVVIIHAAEDALPARALAEKLRAAKLSPVIEQPPGEVLRQAVRNAAVTLALWSPRSVEQPPLIEEVNFAKSKGKVIHARMQNAASPAPFANEKSIDLTGWRGEDDFAGWRELAKAVTDKAGVPLPPPPVRAPSGPAGFFQPGAPAAAAHAGAARPPQRPAQQHQRAQAPGAQAAPRPAAAPRAQQQAASSQSGGGGGRGMMIAIIAIIALAVIGGGGYFVWSNMQGSQAASSAWDNVPRNDAAALRAFIDGDPGDYRDEAEAALATLEERSFDAAQEEDTIEAFENFLNDFPDSDHAIEARGRIAELQSMTPVEETPPEALAPDVAPVDPDLLPPGATDTAPDTPGPATLTPPGEPTPTPEAPTN